MGIASVLLSLIGFVPTITRKAVLDALINRTHFSVIDWNDKKTALRSTDLRGNLPPDGESYLRVLSCNPLRYSTLKHIDAARRIEL